MKPLLLLPALLLVSCEAPAPIIISNPMPAPAPSSYEGSPTSYTPPVSAPVTRTTQYAYPNIAGVWKGPSGTITIGPSNGGPFSVNIVQRDGDNVSSTGHWGQPYHRHFKFKRARGGEAIATLNSLTPTTIAIKNEGGREMTWTRVSGP